MSAEEFYDWLCRPENEERFYELDRGTIVERSYPGTDRHGAVCALVNYWIANYLFKLGRGYGVSNNTGVVIERNPDTVFCPDLMAYMEPPATARNDWFATRIPALVVEVLDHRDIRHEMIAKAERYSASCVPMTWLVCSESKTVNLVLPGRQNQLIHQDENLTGNGVLPDFSCKVADLFALPGSTPSTP